MTRPRTCPACLSKPVATARHDHCYGCLPGGPYPEPPCRRCQASTGYYSAGLCRRCHRFAPPIIDSCIDCYCWGVTRHLGFLCSGCRGWRHRFPTSGACPSCARTVALNVEGWCRLCWRQAAAQRTGRRQITVLEANRHGQQLFFADLFRQRRPVVPRAPRGDDTALPAVPYRQLTLFEAPRDFTGVTAETLTARVDPRLAEHIDRVVRSHAASHGWSKTRINQARQGIRILTALHDSPGAPMHASHVTVVEHFGLSYQPILDVLAGAGLLIEDRQPALLAWFTRQITGLPEPMDSEVRTWFDVLRTGSTTPPRSRPRSEETVRLRIRSAKPALQAWATQGHRSLREITRDDVLAVLPHAGSPRALLGSALRSLFATLKARRLVFANPAVRLRTGRPETRIPLPLELEPLRAVINDEDRPDRAALAALISFHAVRSGQLRTLHLTDLRDGRLHLPDRAVPLATPVRHRLTAWLDHRAQRWPATANPHLFINIQTAARTTPVSGVWIRDTLGMPAQAIREDRILHEATATGGDIRRLCDLFGLSVQAADRYASTLAANIEGEG
jgi:hypothetical protein